MSVKGTKGQGLRGERASLKGVIDIRGIPDPRNVMDEISCIFLGGLS